MSGAPFLSEHLNYYLDAQNNSRSIEKNDVPDIALCEGSVGYEGYVPFSSIEIITMKSEIENLKRQLLKMQEKIDILMSPPPPEA